MPDKTPISIAQAEGLTGDMSALSRKLDHHRRDLARYRRAVQILTVTLFVVGVVAVVAAVAAYRAREATEAANQSRQDARESACVQSNVATDKARKALTNSILVLVPGAKTPDDLNPEQRERYDAYEASVTAALPYRDCTQSGIEEFYDNPPADPARQP